MAIPAKHRGLYGIVTACALFIAVAAAGGGVWGQESHWMLQWQHQVFDMLCHQRPERSFWLGGQPMAVCSRCFGLYSGLLAGVLMLPFFTSARIMRLDLFKKLLAGAVAINLVDLLGNMLAFWQNTLNSRFGLGLLLGLVAAAVMVALFKNNNKRTENLHYGTT